MKSNFLRPMLPMVKSTSFEMRPIRVLRSVEQNQYLMLRWMMLPITSNAAFSLFLVTAMQQQCIKCNGMGMCLTNGAKDLCDFNDENNKNINAYIFMIKNSRGKKVTTKYLFICD